MRGREGVILRERTEANVEGGGGGGQRSVSVAITLRPPCTVAVVFRRLSLADGSRASRISSLV